MEAASLPGRAPDLDRPIRYTTLFGRPGGCRMRVWHDDRVVVLTLDERANHDVHLAAEAVERVLDTDLRDPSGYRLIEHYPPTAMRPMILDRVQFGWRGRDRGLLHPLWCPLPDDLTWLRASIDEREMA